MIEIILKIAEENPDGFTIELSTLDFVTSGIVVAYAETQDSFGRGGLERCIEHAQKHGGYIGGWDSGEGNYYFDSVMIIYDRDEAIREGRKNGQIAIYDLDNAELIKL